MTKIISLSEVAKHNTIESLWVVIHNQIYDVTAYLNEHPGGVDVLLEVAGQVASDAFEDVGHSVVAREEMQKYKIGEVPESEREIEKKTKSGCLQSLMEHKAVVLPITLGILTTLAISVYFKLR